MRKNTFLFIFMLFSITVTVEAQHNSLTESVTSEQLSESTVTVVLTFKNGIDDCPSYGVHGSFLEEMLTALKGKVVKEDLENHQLTLSFENTDGESIKQAILDFAKKNHYPEAHVFDVEIVK